MKIDKNTMLALVSFEIVPLLRSFVFRDYLPFGRAILENKNQILLEIILDMDKKVRTPNAVEAAKQHP